MKSWKASNMETLDAESFSRLMAEVITPDVFLCMYLLISQVHDVMGLSKAKADEADPKPTFSKDVFRLEICGPGEDHLSVIGVPGIFKHTIPGRTSQQGIGIVRDMVLGYMQNPRSVMLTVIPASVDITTQDILEMARDQDREGIRTIGVITKPDLVDEGAEKRVMELVEGKNSQLRLGWSVVRNPGQKQLEDQYPDRGTLEARIFRDEKPWISLDKDMLELALSRFDCGKYRAHIFAANFRKQFPFVIMRSSH